MGTIGEGIELLKLVNKGANADLYVKLAKWIEEAEGLKAHVERLEESNKDLHEQLRFKGKIVRFGPNVYVEGEEEPICPRCADVDNRPVRIWAQRLPNIGVTPVCPHCKNQAPSILKRSRAEAIAKDGKL